MKPRYFKALVPMYIRLDHKDSNPYVTLNGNLQMMEDRCGDVYADTSNIECEQVPDSAVPEELK